MSGNPPSMTGPDSHAIKKLKLADADGDATMVNAALAGEVPSTPRQQGNTARALSSDMSPPDSQGPFNTARDPTTSAALAGSPSINANGKRKHATAASAEASASTSTGEPYWDAETEYQWVRQEDQPGWAWLNPRAREEAARALEHIVDTQYMIKTRFGDPLDATVKAR